MNEYPIEGEDIEQENIFIEEDDDFAGPQGESIICFDIVNNSLGCSILESQSKTLKIFEEDYKIEGLATSKKQKKSLNSNKDDEVYTINKIPNDLNSIIEALITDNLPSVCLLSTNFDEQTVKIIEQLSNSLNFEIEFRPISEFRKFTEDFKDLIQIQSKQERLLIECIFPNNDHKNSIMENNLLVTKSCLVCCLNYLKNMVNTEIVSKNSVTAAKEDINAKKSIYLIRNLKQLFVSDKIFLDYNTISSLRILPFGNKSDQGKNKKDKSENILDLLDHTSTEAAKKLLISWLKYPLSDIRKIRKRHSVLKTLLEKTNSNYFEDICSEIKNIINIQPILNQIFSGNISFIKWKKLKKFLVSSIKLYKLIECLYLDNATDSLFANILQYSQIEVLEIILDEIQRTIDFENSQNSNHLVINEDINAQLDEFRNIYNQLENILGSLAEEVQMKLLEELEESHSFSNTLNDHYVNAIYIPQLGYLLTVDNSLEELLTKSSFQKEWKEIFRTSTNIYYKNEFTETLDNEYGDVYGNLSDLEIEVLQKLSDCIRNYRTILTQFSDFVIELDVFLSLARVSQERNYTEPLLVDDCCLIDIKKGRHPLYENFVESYITNDTYINGGTFNTSTNITENASNIQQTQNPSSYQRIVLLTGANASGKSVFLTQIGLIVFLAQIGCYVPAEMAKLSVVDKILTNIKSQETLYTFESTFERDSKQMSKCLHSATERSLVLIDEYGKGTDMVDGPAIFGGILKSLSKDKNCPLIIASTHFHELFKPSILGKNIAGIKFYQTEILLQDISQNKHIYISSNISTLDIGITFLYRILEGITERSFGIYCAKLCGIPISIIQRGEKLMKFQYSGSDIIQECCSLTEDELQDLSKNKEIVKRFMKWDLDLDGILSSTDLKDKLREIIEYSSV
ncbi:hypothetical protein TBLA_0F02310 [Henningerozyma blattae CBS 6284]|uniref:EF-hand domain-containing protein n=1 Tax=Henningerozyma blattae (strain ATCC 34711 / CBS 6284 / DSM 70876 / NBRC 10599 / NRRL Y-10934 / UCD 77-7) TaxID=1071380 RepID=I2H5X0_HENB6|nr:hypothetical protein TBLA_0F02310 [Tetrapisispora blattae CBS 6284]CCH61772.1 hypothetical protein TBLA_0F02310 [Tetrapisispora blattae CBS 6284]